MGIVLSFVALFLFVVVYLIDGVAGFVINVKNRKWFKLVNRQKFNNAFKVDVFGNFLFANFWNAVFSKGGYKFGVFGETISSCFGRKRLESSLTWFGWLISLIIDAVDFSKWFKGGHCKASIMTNEDILNFLNR